MLVPGMTHGIGYGIKPRSYAMVAQWDVQSLTATQASQLEKKPFIYYRSGQPHDQLFSLADIPEVAFPIPVFIVIAKASSCDIDIASAV